MPKRRKRASAHQIALLSKINHPGAYIAREFAFGSSAYTGGHVFYGVVASPTIEAMEKAGWIKEVPREEGMRRGTPYRITEAGREELARSR